MEHSATLFLTTFVLYCAAAVLYMWSMVGEPARISRAATYAAALGLAAHTAGIALRGIELHRAPFSNLFESLTFGAWALMAIYLVMGRKYRMSALGTFVSLIALITIIFGSIIPKGVSGSLVPALQSNWSVIHVTTSLISYASFTVAFAAALGYVLQEHMLKRKKINGLRRRLPSLDVMDHLAYKMVALGFPMLTLGVITGALWAQSAWGTYWNWDPKETWSLITWLVYAAYLHVRIVQGWQGKWANRLLIAGFACILITYLGVNFLSPGLHKYNW